MEAVVPGIPVRMEPKRPPEVPPMYMLPRKMIPVYPGITKDTGRNRASAMLPVRPGIAPNTSPMIFPPRAMQTLLKVKYVVIASKIMIILLSAQCFQQPFDPFSLRKRNLDDIGEQQIGECHHQYCKQDPVPDVQFLCVGQKRAIADSQKVQVFLLPQLVEISYGEWEGRTGEDILTTDRELYEAWWQHPATVAPPGGETLNQVDSRCRAAWDYIRSHMTGDTAVVAHGGTLAHFIMHILEGQPDAQEIVVGNASITTVEFDPETGACRLLDLNDGSHLSKC